MTGPEHDGPHYWDRASIQAIISGMRLRGVSDGSPELLEALLYDAESYQRCAARKQLALEQRDEARTRLAIARLVAEHRSDGNTDPTVRESLAMVLAALEGEADPAQLGVDGPLGHAIRTHRASRPVPS